MKRRYALVLMLAFLAACSTVRQETLPGSGYAVASWYGPDFNGRPTSSGEIFNMYAMTCAHKEYPFGTKVRVTNVANNKTAECVVNDRGPFVEGRDIDLSYAVAKEIEMIGPGTGKVFLEVDGRDMSYIRKVKVQSAGKTGPFAIQVGSFAESINAVRLKVALRLKYGNVYIQDAELKGATYYRVRIGNFESLNSAVSTAEQLGQEGYPAVVMKADVKI
ncbi:MAG: septal ring lytic transglycosylase RlpA family protein [Acidobacteriota bacterium]